MARDARIEWVPTSALVNPSSSMPMLSTAVRTSWSISLKEILMNLSPSWNVKIGHLSE